MSPWRTGTALLLSAAALSWPIVALATPGASQADTASSSLPDARASNPPLITVRKGKEGAMATGKQVKKGRLAGGSTEPKQKKKPRYKKQTSSLKGPLNRNGKRPPSTRLKQSVRLNVGICGRVQPDGAVPGPNWCQPVVPGRPDTPQGTTPVMVRPRPEDVTWDQVFTESKNVLFKKLTVYVQPKDKTLVNLETIVYTEKTGVLTYPVTILGFPVIVKATPSKYIWSFGDGSSKTTYSAGSPYPSKEITHRYLKRGDVRLSVTVEYAASFEVAGLEPQFVGPVPITGPSTPLQVREAVPVLVDPPR